MFICNTYHHIEDRPDYFSDLKADLSPGGRAAVVDPNAELGGLLGLFKVEGHVTRAGELVAEMEAAGYRRSRSFEFLPVQVFEVFVTDGPGS